MIVIIEFHEALITKIPSSIQTLHEYLVAITSYIFISMSGGFHHLEKLLIYSMGGWGRSKV